MSRDKGRPGLLEPQAWDPWAPSVTRMEGNMLCNPSSYSQSSSQTWAGTSCARIPGRILKDMTVLQVVSILRVVWQVPVVMLVKTIDSVKPPLALES